MAQVISLIEAAKLIRDNDTVFIGGSGGGHAVPEAMIDALRDRHVDTSEPRGLTLVSSVSIGDWESTGFNKLANPTLVRRVINGGFNNCPAFAALRTWYEVEAYTLPQGVLSQLTRDM